MQRQILRYGALLFAGALALAGCSGDKGSVGPAGPAGTNGTNGTNGTDGANGKDLTATAKPETCEVCHGGAGAQHQSLYTAFTNGLNPATSKLVANVVGVASAPNGDGTFTSTLTFTASLNGSPLTAAQVKALKQKRFTATAYDAGTNTFTTATAISYDNTTIADGAGGQITITAAAAGFAPEAAGSNAFVYLYLGDKLLISNEPTTAGRYNLLANVASAAKVYGAIGYTSAANVSGCEQCHPAPYSKHGYRQATVAGLADFVACKACHTDQAPGTDFVFQVLADDPAAAAVLPVVDGEIEYTPEQKAKYAYVATVLNDTHMSHAMEFTYPQSMANCVTCHAGKLDRILADSNFKLSTCKSCHPVTGTGGNAPPLLGTDPARPGVMPAGIHPWSLYEPYTGYACTMCHNSGTQSAPSFAEIHSGYDKQIYKDAGTKFSSAVTTKIDSASFDATTNKLTVAFSVAGADATALVKPTVVASLYGYGTKDFVVSGHGSAADGKRNLEYTEGATNNSARLTVDPGTAAAGVTAWTATADLSLWASLITSGEVKRIELAVLPTLGLNQALAVSKTNPAIAIAGTSMTFDLVGNAIDTNAYGKGIVAASKCNSCHGALAITFHNPNYGSAGVVGCRVCHTVRDGGSHLEMQSRSIDSYIHAIHSFQAFDVGHTAGSTSGIDFTDPVEAMEYEHHIGATYPNFTILNCESCHTTPTKAVPAVTYEVPDQSKSLPSVLSKASANDTWNRAIGAVPAYITGPGSRACGSCHRSQMIKQDDAGALASFNQHVGSMGYMLETTTGTGGTSAADLDAAIAEIFKIFAK